MPTDRRKKTVFLPDQGRGVIAAVFLKYLTIIKGYEVLWDREVFDLNIGCSWLSGGSGLVWASGERERERVREANLHSMFFDNVFFLPYLKSNLLSDECEVQSDPKKQNKNNTFRTDRNTYTNATYVRSC